MADDEKIQDMNYDGKWRPERDLNGRWIAVRYVDYGPTMNGRYGRERDVEQRRGYLIPNYFDLLDQATVRCDELNGLLA